MTNRKQVDERIEDIGTALIGTGFFSSFLVLLGFRKPHRRTNGLLMCLILMVFGLFFWLHGRKGKEQYDR